MARCLDGRRRRVGWPDIGAITLGFYKVILRIICWGYRRWSHLTLTIRCQAGATRLTRDNARGWRYLRASNFTSSCLAAARARYARSGGLDVPGRTTDSSGVRGKLDYGFSIVYPASRH